MPFSIVFQRNSFEYHNNNIIFASCGGSITTKSLHKIFQLDLQECLDMGQQTVAGIVRYIPWPCASKLTLPYHVYYYLSCPSIHPRVTAACVCNAFEHLI